MSTTQTLIRNSIFRNVQFFIMVIVTFLMTPFIVQSLGDRYYGFWTLVGTFMGYYGLLDLGLSSAVARYVSQALGKDDFKSMSAIASTSFGLFTAISALALLVTLIVVSACPLFIKNPEEVALFRKVFLLMGMTVAIGFPFRVFGGILTSFLRHDLIALISITRTISANVAIYYFLSQGHGILSLVIINCLASMFEYFSTYLLCRAKFPLVEAGLKHFDRSRIRELFTYSGKTLVIQIADLLRFRVDALVIAIFLNVSLVTYYSIGSKLIDYFGWFMVSTIGFVGPLFSQYEGRGDFETLRKRFLDITKISTVLSVFIGMSIIFYGKPFIARWMGPGFESSYLVAVILCIPAMIALTQTAGLQMLYGLSKHHYYAISNVCEGLLNLLLSIVLVKHYGMYGVALGTAAEMVLFKIFIQPVFICRAIGLPVTDYVIKTILLTAVKSLLPLLIYFYLITGYMKADYLHLFAFASVQSLLFIPVFYFFILNKEMKQLIRGAIGFT